MSEPAYAERARRPDRIVLDDRIVGRRRTISFAFAGSQLASTTASLVTPTASAPSREASREETDWRFQATTLRDAIVTIASDRREELALPGGGIARLPEPVHAVDQIAVDRYLCSCYADSDARTDHLYCIDSSGAVLWRIAQNPDRSPTGAFRYDVVLVDGDGDVWVGNERSMQYRLDLATGAILERGFAPATQRWR